MRNISFHKLAMQHLKLGIKTTPDGAYLFSMYGPQRVMDVEPLMKEFYRLPMDEVDVELRKICNDTSLDVDATKLVHFILSTIQNDLTYSWLFHDDQFDLLCAAGF